MGVAGLWDVLRPAGKLRSLTHLSVKDGFEANPDGKRGFRVGIDASIWFYHATYGREGENPELRTLFFRCTRLMEKPILPLFVFDGPKRPEIKRGKRISGKNHWMVQGMQEIISAFGFEWRMAPGEAEAELAYLNRIGVIDAVLSDDVDTFLFGAKMVVRNPSVNLSGNRAHAMKNAAGKDDGNHVMTYAAADFSRDDIQLTQGGLILIGVLRGGDYSDGLERCGVATAHGLAKAGFGDTLLDAARTLPRDTLEDFLVGWRQDIRNELRTNASGRLQRKSPSLAKAIPEDFPDIDVLLAYTNPVTSEAKGPGHKNAVVDWDKEPDLGRIAGLCEMYFEWGVKEIIIKRFRTVLWPSAVLRILRRAALIKDRKAAALVARNPQTPRKSGKEHRAPPGTPSSMITKHFARFTLNTPGRNGQDDDDDAHEDEDGERLIVKIHSARRHASTDDVLEYRLEVAPAQLVRLCEAGIKGLRTSLPPNLSDSDEGDEDEDDEGTGKKGKKKTSKPPPDPDSHLRIWLPACMVALVEPELVDEFEGVEQQKAEKKAAKGTKGRAKKNEDTKAKAKKTKLPAVALLVEADESASEDDVPAPQLSLQPTKAKTSAAVSIKPTTTAKTGDKANAVVGAPKINGYFAAKKPSAATTKAAKTSSNTAKIAELFKDIPKKTKTDRYESEESTDEEVPGPSQLSRFPSQATSSASSFTSSSAPNRHGSTSSSSRMLSFLDSQGSRPATGPLQSAALNTSPPKARPLRPFPMDFDMLKDGEHTTARPQPPASNASPSKTRAFRPFPMALEDTVKENRRVPSPALDDADDLFAAGTRSSYNPSSSRTRARPSSDSDSEPQASAHTHRLQKSPRRSEKHSSPRSTPRKAQTQGTPRKEEEEESSSSDDGRAPSPSPFKGRQSTATPGKGQIRSPCFGSARKDKEEDRAPSPSPSRRKVLPVLSTKPLPRPVAARKPAPFPADMSIISISSGSDTDSPPPAKAHKVAPLLLARTRLATTSNTTSRAAQPALLERKKAPPRIYDPADIIDLT